MAEVCGGGGEAVVVVGVDEFVGECVYLDSIRLCALVKRWSEGVRSIYLQPISSTVNDSRKVISRSLSRNLPSDLSCSVYILYVLFLSRDLSVLFAGAGI